MRKRFWICGIVVSAAALLLDVLIHGVLLRADYAALVPSGLYRLPADANAYLPYAIGAHLLIGFGLTWLYRKGVRPGRSAPGQGLRFGAAVAAISTIPASLLCYAMQPLPFALLQKQVLFGTIAMLLLGLLLAWLNPARRTL